MSDYGYYGNDNSGNGNSGNSGNVSGYSNGSANGGSYGAGSSSSNGSYGSGYSNYNYSNANGYNAYGGQGSYGGYNQGNQNPYSQKPKKEKKPHPTLKKAGKLVAAGLVFGLCASLMFTGTTYVTQKITGKSVTGTTAKSLSTSDGKLDSTSTSSATTVTDVSDIAENVTPAIVQVTNVSLDVYQGWFGQLIPHESTSAGSGIIISQDDDYIYIATNNHVVEGARELTITFCDDKAVSAQVHGTNEASDLAVVKVAVKDLDSSTLSAIKVATIGDSDNVKVGQGAVVIGNAMGYGISVTTGVVSALDREVQVQSETTGQTVTYSGLMQTNAAVNPGNSGGAIVNMNGEVIGVVSAKYVDTTAEGMGYAIPITKAKTILEKLMNGQTVTDEDVNPDKEGTSADASSTQTAYLGIYGADITANMASSYNMPTGVFVTAVASDSGAEKAGIQKRDIITAIDGNAVSAMTDMQNYLKSKKPGDTVTLTVAVYSQNYQTGDITVTLGEKPADTQTQQ